VCVAVFVVEISVGLSCGRMIERTKIKGAKRKRGNIVNCEYMDRHSAHKKRGKVTNESEWRVARELIVQSVWQRDGHDAGVQFFYAFSFVHF